MLSELERKATILLKDNGADNETIGMCIALSRLTREHPVKIAEQYSIIVKQVAITTSLLRE